MGERSPIVFPLQLFLFTRSARPHFIHRPIGRRVWARVREVFCGLATQHRGTPQGALLPQYPPTVQTHPLHGIDRCVGRTQRNNGIGQAM